MGRLPPETLWIVLISPQKSVRYDSSVQEGRTDEDFAVESGLHRAARSLLDVNRLSKPSTS